MYVKFIARMHRVAASDRWAVAFSLSGGNARDARKENFYIEIAQRYPEQIHMLMDRAYEGDKTRAKGRIVKISETPACC